MDETGSLSLMTTVLLSVAVRERIGAAGAAELARSVQPLKLRRQSGQNGRDRLLELDDDRLVVRRGQGENRGRRRGGVGEVGTAPEAATTVRPKWTRPAP